jgi:hypothetical protein
MTAASLPQYPGRRKAAPPAPERNLSDLVASRRVHGLLIRLLFVFGIWGGLFAFRSELLSRETDNARRKEIIGNWETTDGSEIRLEITGFGEFTIFFGERWRLTGKYEYLGDGTFTATADHLWDQKTHVNLSGPFWTFTTRADGDALTILGLTRTDEAIGLSSAPGASVQFTRKR